MIVRVTVGGSRVRIRLSNAVGGAAVTIGSAHIALRKQGSEILASSDRVLTFGGQASTTVYAGAMAVSDSVSLEVPPLADLAISLYIPKPTEAPTTHMFGLRPTYLSARGDATGAPSFPNPSTTESYYWLAGLDVLAPSDAATIVAFGDSITDGDQSTPDTHGSWPDILAQRLQANKATRRFGVVNAGISGNRVLGDNASGIVRLSQDALRQPGIRWLMLLEGINDITGATRQPGPPTLAAKDLIAAYKQIIETAHLYGVKVVGCTLTPYGGSPAHREAGERIRTEVNEWIRTSHAFDAVVDFDAATRDPKDPLRFKAEVDSPDMLHPANPGYKMMADAVDLAIFTKK
jgi:lysophospholipase L1-like esterase